MSTNTAWSSWETERKRETLRQIESERENLPWATWAEGGGLHFFGQSSSISTQISNIKFVRTTWKNKHKNIMFVGYEIVSHEQNVATIASNEFSIVGEWERARDDLSAAVLVKVLGCIRWSISSLQRGAMARKWTKSQWASERKRMGERVCVCEVLLTPVVRNAD